MSGFMPQKISKARSQTDLYASMSNAALFVTVKRWKQPNDCPGLTDKEKWYIHQENVIQP